MNCMIQQKYSIVHVIRTLITNIRFTPNQKIVITSYTLVPLAASLAPCHYLFCLTSFYENDKNPIFRYRNSAFLEQS